MSIIAKLITPPSAADSNLETYEYYLVWTTDQTTGTVESELFYDYRINSNIEKRVINTKDSVNIKSVLDQDYQEITLVGENLTRNQYDTLLEAIKSGVVYRYYTDNTREKLASLKLSDTIRNSDQRFNVELKIRTVDSA